MIKIEKVSIFVISILSICLSHSTPVYGSVLLSNDKLNILVSNQQSWTGINGKGNLSYYGCDRNYNCIYLTGGIVTCRHGVCSSSWKNQNYRYILSSPITSTETADNELPTTLTILNGTQVLLTEELYPQPFDN